MRSFDSRMCCFHHHRRLLARLRASIQTPNGCPRITQDGRLPLHWAANKKSEEDVVLLLDAHPEGAKEKDAVCAAQPSHLPTNCL